MDAVLSFNASKLSQDPGEVVPNKRLTLKVRQVRQFEVNAQFELFKPIADRRF